MGTMHVAILNHSLQTKWSQNFSEKAFLVKSNLVCGNTTGLGIDNLSKTIGYGIIQAKGRFKELFSEGIFSSSILFNM